MDISFLSHFRDFRFGGVYLRLYFEGDRLGRVDFGWGPKVPISDWTKQRVQADVDRYRRFLFQNWVQSGRSHSPLGRAWSMRQKIRRPVPQEWVSLLGL